MPTSRTYIVLLTRGCSPWRPAADMGTVQRQNFKIFPRFSRADDSSPDTAGGAVLYGNNIPISGQAYSRASVSLQRKENSSQGYRQRLVVRLRYRILVPKDLLRRLGSGILNRFPFDHIRTDTYADCFPYFEQGISQCLRAD